MKKVFLTMVAAICVIIGMYAYPMNTAKQGFVNVRSFDNITVSAPLKVRVLQSDTFAVNVMAKDSVILNSIKYSIEDGTLNIYSDDDYEDLTKKAHVVITTPNAQLPDVNAGDGYAVLRRKFRVN